MTRAFTTATAIAAALLALAPAAGAGPVRLAQMKAAPNIQVAPPPNLARPPAITPRLDTSRLAGEDDEEEDGTAGSVGRLPQETVTGAEHAPELARRSPTPPVAERPSHAPLPPVRPDLVAGNDPAGALDAQQARGAAEAREAAEAAAAIEVERSDLGGLGDPLREGGGDEAGDPRFGGMTPEEYKARFGLGGMKSPEDVAAGLATQYNDLGNRGTGSPAGDFAAGIRPDPTSIPRGDLASDKSHRNPDGSVQLPGEGEYVRTDDSGWEAGTSGQVMRTVTKYRADGSSVVRTDVIYRNANRSTGVSELDAEGNQTYRHYTLRDSEGNVLREETDRSPGLGGEGVAELHTPETAPGTGGGCAPSDGSAACNELRRLMREGNKDELTAGGKRVNPGDPDSGATGGGPRLTISEEELVGNPDPHRMEGGGGGRSARQIDGGKLVNPAGPNE